MSRKSKRPRFCASKIGILFAGEGFNSGERECDSLVTKFSQNATKNVDQVDADKFLGLVENVARTPSNEWINIENRTMPRGGEFLPLLEIGYIEDHYTLAVNAINIRKISTRLCEITLQEYKYS